MTPLQHRVVVASTVNITFVFDGMSCIADILNAHFLVLHVLSCYVDNILG